MTLSPYKRRSQQPQLLLVDDNEVDVLAFQRLMNHKLDAVPINITHDGVEALEFLRKQPAHEQFVILLDLQMPRMNGHEFLQTLRSDPQLRHNVVFILTTSTNVDDIKAAYQHNVAGYLKKPSPDRAHCLVGLLQHYLQTNRFPTERRLAGSVAPAHL